MSALSLVTNDDDDDSDLLSARTVAGDDELVRDVGVCADACAPFCVRTASCVGDVCVTGGIASNEFVEIVSASMGTYAPTRVLATVACVYVFFFSFFSLSYLSISLSLSF